jgi:hypothetical protein
MAAAEQSRVQKIADLVVRIDGISDPDSRQCARELMEAILELHGAGLERMMEIASELKANNADAAADPGEVIIRRFGNDELVAALLVLHNLHPDDIETRVLRALRKWHGAAELQGVWEGVVRVRLSGGGCGMKDAVELAIRDAAPDATEVIIEDIPQAAAFVPLAALEFGRT